MPPQKIIVSIKTNEGMLREVRSNCPDLVVVEYDVQDAQFDPEFGNDGAEHQALPYEAAISRS